MSDLVPLLLVLALCASKRSSGPSSPLWPSAASPPPMPPLPGPPPPPPGADTGTPLSDLAQPQTTLEKAEKTLNQLSDASERLVRKNLGLKPKPKPRAAARARKLAPVDKLTAETMARPAFLDYAPPDKDVSVYDVQKVLVRSGYKAIKQDGLYGPKTELAWKTLANGRKLSPAIVRRSPKVARVNQDTFTALSVP